MSLWNQIWEIEDAKEHWRLVVDLEQRTHLRVAKMGLVGVGIVRDEATIPIRLLVSRGANLRWLRHTMRQGDALAKK
ncbi:hypothetical protein PanWU01x14_220090 [Parasponia andersonii]|uniref:Uncharacterized protein n=1 Tax=Parasponia andersonii TaxID=3476 RepID=A0A2P5BQB6_PARAD|nr:hypothetical protein PanWU01x14_220090 [Parasponia andersonii]